jgi:hypothetical protein
VNCWDPHGGPGGVRPARRATPALPGPSSLWEVKPSPGKGRGLFATANILAGERICGGPNITAPYGALHGTVLEDHACDDAELGVTTLTMSPHVLCNHSDDPNCECDCPSNVDWLIATRNIAAGQELTINYNTVCDWGFDLGTTDGLINSLEARIAELEGALRKYLDWSEGDPGLAEIDEIARAALRSDTP